MVKVLDLHNHPDGRHWRRKVHVHQLHPLPQEALYIDIIYIKLIPRDKPDFVVEVLDLHKPLYWSQALQGSSHPEGGRGGA